VSIASTPSLDPFSDSSAMGSAVVATLERTPEPLASHYDEPELDAASPRACAAATDPVLAPDSLQAGILFVLAATLVQRLVGMVRSILFCDMMSEAEVGLFSLGFSSLILLAPFAVLGIPGSFGRYVEYYRQRNALGAYLKRTICVSLGLGAALSLLIILLAPWAAVVLFNDASQGRLAVLTGISLFFVVTFNLLNELATALRKTRRASWMQFVSSIVFAAAGISLIWLSGGLAEYALLGYAIACFAASLVAWPVLKAVWSITDSPSEGPGQRQMWSKLLPYTAWFWAFNLLTNVFDISDRYLILWWSQATAAEAQALVGQLHSARVFPVLIVGLATMIGGILLPHLSHDWELGRRDEVARKLRFALKLTSLVFCLISAGVILAAPMIFHVVWKGRYDQGLGLLPITCAMCVWQCLTIMAQQYLWCTERARLACVPILVGLATGLALNAFLLPRFGIEGAAVSAAIANFAALAASLILAQTLGLRNSASIATFVLWPGVLMFGLWSGAMLFVLPLLGGLGLLLLLEPKEKEILQVLSRRVLVRLAPRSSAAIESNAARKE
jgi:polysaccharide transporter, PST family